jgi:ribosomal-protein-alanine N-acetyltransferase
MAILRLVQIDSSGHPAEPTGHDLPEVAREVCTASADLYETAGFIPPWVGYLAVLENECVGTCAFKSPPSGNRVEIAYFTFPGHEGHGFATSMAQALIELAAEARPGVVIVAQTLPETNASNAILRRLGFQFVGAVQHPQDGRVWECTYATASPPFAGR